jgi:hypothetical protein
MDESAAGGQADDKLGRSQMIFVKRRPRLGADAFDQIALPDMLPENRGRNPVVTHDASSDMQKDFRPS